MQNFNLSRILFKLHRVSCWGLAFLIFLFIISGYGMTQGVIDRKIGGLLHSTILPPPLFLLFSLHLAINLRTLFLRAWGIENEKWINVWSLGFGLILLVFCFYLYLL